MATATVVPPVTPPRVTLDLSLNEAIYVYACLGHGNQWRIFDSRGGSVYDVLDAALRGAGVPDPDATDIARKTEEWFGR